MSWSLKFDEPIAAPNHLKLRTLRDAGEYVTALPKADQAKPLADRGAPAQPGLFGRESRYCELAAVETYTYIPF
jgi:hypothetical protein